MAEIRYTIKSDLILKSVEIEKSPPTTWNQYPVDSEIADAQKETL